MRINTTIEVREIQPIGIVLEYLRNEINDEINMQLTEGATKSNINLISYLADRANLNKLHLMFAEKKLASEGKSAKSKVKISVCINQLVSLYLHFRLTDPSNPAQLITNQFIANLIKKL